MFVFIGSLFIVITLISFILTHIKKQYQRKNISLLIAAAAILVNAGGALYYNNLPAKAGGLRLDGLGNFVVCFVQAICAVVLFIIMYFTYKIQSKRKK